MYYVTSDGDQPEQLFFSTEAAVATAPNFIDVFDGDGYRIASYKRVDGDYTQDF